MENTWPLLVNAVALGFRHGIDWDHIAAITDIVGTSTAVDTTDSAIRARALGLSSMYAFGHAGIVAVLGVCALYFAAVLPLWVDPIMERLVGWTLLLLGAWIFISLIGHFRGHEDFRLQSRWMLILTAITQTKDWLYLKFTGEAPPKSLPVSRYGVKTAFGVGVIHGIGAETGTQVLLIAAIGGASSHGLGAAMLISFLVGLLVSNTMVAIVGTTGFMSSSRLKPLYLTVGVVTCCFSLAIGAFFALGQAESLPDLGHLLTSTLRTKQPFMDSLGGHSAMGLLFTRVQ